MINFIVLDSNKKIVGAGSMPNSESVDKNVKENCTWISIIDDDVIHNISKYYWSNKNRALELIPERPSEGEFEFSLENEEWMNVAEEFNLLNYSKHVIIDLKQYYTSIELGGFLFMGKIIQSDVLSQQRIQSAIVDGSIDWIAADNSILSLSEEQFSELKKALSDHIKSVRSMYNAKKQRILNATSKSEIEEILNA